MMKALVVILALVTLGAAFGAGRFTTSEPRSSAEISIDDFSTALENPDRLTRTVQLSKFLEGLSPGNLPDALEALEARLRFVEEEDLALLMFAWARFDPEAALVRALVWPTHSRQRGSLAAISAWGYYGPENALVGLRLVDDAKLKSKLKIRLVTSWIDSPNRATAIDFVAAMDAGLTRQRFVSQLAAEYMGEGSEALKRWAESIPDDANQGFKTTVFEKASNVLATVDPLDTASWIAGHMEHEYGQSSIVLIARRWADRDVREAFEWVVGLPAGKDREFIVGQIFGRWEKQDSDAAETWIRENTPAPGSDAAVRVLVKDNVKDEPSIALDWALRIHDSELREEVLVRVGRYWVRRDAEAAKAWLAESAIDEATQHAILTKPKGTGSAARKSPRAAGLKGRKGKKGKAGAGRPTRRMGRPGRQARPVQEGSAGAGVQAP